MDWQTVEDSEFQNWKWQLQNSISTLEDLKTKLDLSLEEEQVFLESAKKFQFSITPYYLNLIEKNNPHCPIRIQAIPKFGELQVNVGETSDPLAEEMHMPVKGVTHRYPDRALWYVSHTCAVYCRFCTRKRKVSKNFETPNKQELMAALEYFQTHTEIKEVILSGGDPLSLGDVTIDYLLGSLKKIEHINQVRIHTRHPVTLPMRITDALCEIFQKHFPIYLVTHFNHPREITTEAKTAVARLIRKGNVIVLNQSVLLKGVNDSKEVLQELFYGLTKIGVKPYYLHNCDEITGIGHFRVSFAKGLEIFDALRGHMSGISVPSFVQDLTGGGGKILLSPDYFQKETPTQVLFRNYRHNEYWIQKPIPSPENP